MDIKMKPYLLLFATYLICVAQTFAQNQEIRLFSHRGGRLEHDENTLRAFEASYRAGYRGFETDVRMTRDGALVITHDSSLERTTDGKGVVEQHTRAEIEQLHTRQGNKVLFLDELLRFLHDKPGLYVEFEMKTAPQHLYPPVVLRSIATNSMKQSWQRSPQMPFMCSRRAIIGRCAICNRATPE